MSEDRKIDTKKNNNPPENKPFVTGLIVTLLMALSLFLGIVAGPMFTTWYKENFEPVQHEMADAGEATQEHDHESENQWYVCPMHPWVVQPEEGLCPICIMDLVPLDPERFSNEIVIDPVVLQNIGVRTALVSIGPANQEIRVSASVALDERRIADINIKSGGWIEKLYVSFEGAKINKGQKLLEIYSPELLVTQKDLLLLLKDKEKNVELITLARKRLELFDIDPDQIAEIEKSGKPRRTFTFYSPLSGYLMAKSVDQGSQVKPGQRAFRIWDGRVVWLNASVPEVHLGQVSLNQKVKISIEQLPGKTLEGVVSFIAPEVDLKTREAEVRIDLQNAGGVLKPGMYAQVMIQSGSDEKDITLAPSEAVVNTGERKIAFISHGNGKFEPRNVVIGRYLGDGNLEILSGLEAGESVVVSGQFLLDSESKIRESLVKMIEGRQAAKQLPQKEFSPEDKIDISATGRTTLDETLKTYLDIKNSLYNNSFSQVKNQSAGFVENIRVLSRTPRLPEAEQSALADGAAKFGKSVDIHQARIAFGFIGKALDGLLRKAGIADFSGQKITGLRCGMFKEAPDGGVWLQFDDKVKNPFFGKGSGMAACSSEKWEYASEEKKPEPRAEAVAAVVVKRPVVESSVAAIDIAELLRPYLKIHSSLYLDLVEGIGPEAGEIAQLTADSKETTIQKIHDAAAGLIEAQDIKTGRREFGALGIALDELIKKRGMPDDFEFAVVGKKCGMYPDAPQSGVWIQKRGEIENPFFGHEHAMAHCAPGEWSYAGKGEKQ